MNSTIEGIQIDAANKVLAVNTGEIYGDILVLVVIGVVIVLSIFSYGYFFGTREVDAKVEAAVKAEREKIQKRNNLLGERYE
jgi:hypothetical protein